MTGRKKIQQNISQLMISKKRSMRHNSSSRISWRNFASIKENGILYKVVIFTGITFGNLAPNQAFINIGKTFICWPAQPNQQRLLGIKNIAGTYVGGSSLNRQAAKFNSSPIFPLMQYYRFSCIMTIRRYPVTIRHDDSCSPKFSDFV